MADQSNQRRPAAVLAADVAGCTRLMEEDTEGTVTAWQDARDNEVEPSVADHSGNLVKLTGDGFLVEFPTVQGAVNCAIAMQQGLMSNSVEFRTSFFLGDIIDDGEDNSTCTSDGHQVGADYQRTGMITGNYFL